MSRETDSSETAPRPRRRSLPWEVPGALGLGLAMAMVWAPVGEWTAGQDIADALAESWVSAAAGDTTSAIADPGPAPMIGFAMTEGVEVRGPRGFYELCARTPEHCPAPVGAPVESRLTLDARAWAVLNQVNASANAAHRAMTDPDAYGAADFWTLPRGVADCEDYVLAKRAALIGHGAPAEALLIGVVEGLDTEFHAVLVVRTDRGDLVLDNLEPAIRFWTATPYTWVIRQSQADPARWVRISGAIAPQAAVRQRHAALHGGSPG